MSNRRSPDVGSWHERVGLQNTTRWLRIGWWVFQVLAAAGMAYSAWRLLGHTPYRIDVDVYRMGGQAWLDVGSTSTAINQPAWLRRCWLAIAIVAPAVIHLEPIRANFDFGQINVV